MLQTIQKFGSFYLMRKKKIQNERINDLLSNSKYIDKTPSKNFTEMKDSLFLKQLGI